MCRELVTVHPNPRVRVKREGEGEAREGEDEGQTLQLAPRQARRESTPRPCASPVNSAAYQRNQGSSGACMPPLPPPLPLSESNAAVSTSTRRERGLVAGWLEENANLSVACEPFGRQPHSMVDATSSPLPESPHPRGPIQS